MFAVRSNVPVRVERAFDGLQRLATEHRHGWGVARLDGQVPWVETSVTSAERCPRFELIGEETSTTALLAHIRLASVGAVRESNNHPFFASGWAFMHNGTLRRFEEVRHRIEAEIAPFWRARLKGDTDSERCFALFLTYLEGRGSVDLGDVTRALVRVIRFVEGVCDEGASGENRSAMNFIVSDGRRLVATRRGRTLFTAHRPQTCFLASEHLWEGEAWECVPEDGVVTIEADLKSSCSALGDW